ncbi:transcriptional regulator, AsnC family [Poseidonocella pacifica]|uniref:Transcriptional regulator, AsnC family n=1 Tax=Poseidonocella pacifica TaxID=871651 RepID=A0A1I0WES3_9RHOB|nr:Lrp/AsnC family transcriptional regulator [Poseidonocella pacifica]SFA87222.1 transcriptional regulator, AsnC family [Poseidonocella pacifica]
MSRSPRLDRYDFAILRELQANGRMTKTALAEAVNLSPSPCWERLKRLEEGGLITGYRAMIDIRKFAPVTVVLVEITLEGHKAEDFRRFEAQVKEIPEVCDCWATGGGVDYILRLVLRDVDAYQRLMDGLLDSDAGIERYFGYIVTKSVKDIPDPLPEPE